MTVAEELRAKDPATTGVEELQAAAADVRAELDQFLAVADGPLVGSPGSRRDAVFAMRPTISAACQEMPESEG